MGLSSFIDKRKIKKFEREEKMKYEKQLIHERQLALLEKEKLKLETDIIRKQYEEKIKQNQEKCDHKYEVIGHYCNTEWGLVQNTTTSYFDLVCVKCTKELQDVNEYNKNLILNKQKLFK